MNRRRGFTLLEATVALTIVGLVALGALQAFSLEAAVAQRTRATAPAVALASERVARLQLLDARTLRWLPDSSQHGRVVDHERWYAWSASVAPVPDQRDLYTVEVAVRWDTGHYLLATRVYRPDAEEGQ